MEHADEAVFYFKEDNQVIVKNSVRIQATFGLFNIILDENDDWIKNNIATFKAEDHKRKPFDVLLKHDNTYRLYSSCDYIGWYSNEQLQNKNMHTCYFAHKCECPVETEVELQFDGYESSSALVINNFITEYKLALLAGNNETV